jgi:hypothetical protein
VAYKFLIIKSRDATFFENIFPMKDSVASSSQPIYICALKPSYNSEPTTEIEQVTEQDLDAPWRSKRQKDCILTNETWKICDCLVECKPVGCKWVFKKKLKPTGTIGKYKARLVAKGFTQKEGEDFFNTYSPVTRLTTIRVLVALAASQGLLIHQMDVKTAFLNGELDEEIYMQ